MSGNQTVEQTLLVGANGTSGTLNIPTGASLTVGSGQMGALIDLGNGGSGTLDVSGGTLTFNGLASDTDSRLWIGRAAGDVGVFNLSAGTVNLSSGLVVAGAASSGTFTQTGGTLNIGSGGQFLIGTAGTYTISGAANLVGSTALVDNGSFDLSGMTTAVPLTDRAILAAAPDPSPNAGIVLNSLAGSGMVNSTNRVLVVGLDNTSTAFSGTITNGASGRFLKLGSGTMTIDGATISGGESYVAQGAFAIDSGNTNITYLSLGTGAGNQGQLQVTDGALTIGTALQVGDFGGTGSVNQTGGSVAVVQGCGSPTDCAAVNIGNQGGSGTYVISGGALSISDGFMTVGRNDSSHAASTGLLQLSGTGDVTVTRSSLIVGDNVPSSTPGSGTIMQTGGTLTVDGASFLYLSGSGNGTYDLAGGTLQIGGSSLVTNYQEQSGVYALNLSGGTIQAFGTALTTDANASLSGSSSTIDTNGLGVTWTGVLSGTGALNKVGAGNLTLGAANTYAGGTTLSAGTLTLGNQGAIGSGLLAMAAGTTLAFNGSYALPNSVTVTGDPSFDVPAGTTAMLAGVVSDGTSPGDLVKVDAGTLVLTAANTYTGTTTISGGVLALSGAGSIARSASVVDNATFDISGASGDSAISSLSGSGQVNLGAHSLTLTAATNTFSGVIAGTGGLNLGGGQEILTGANTYTGPTTITGGTLEVDGSLASVVKAGNGATLSGSGTVAGIAAQAGSTISPAGTNIGKLTVAGNLTQASGATYLFQFSGAAADHLAVNGAATLLNGSVLSISPLSDAFEAGTRYTVLSASGGVAGTYTLQGTTLSAFYAAQALYDANNVYLTIVQTQSFEDAGDTPNEKETGGGLDSVPPGGDLGDAVGDLPNDEAADAALNKLSGEIHAAAKTALIEQSSYQRDIPLDRLREAFCATTGTHETAARTTDNANGVCDPDRTVAWSRLYGVWGHTDGNSNYARLARSVSGFLMGVDTPVASNWRVGAYGGFDQSTFDLSERQSTGVSNNYNIGAYAGSQFGSFDVRLGAAYAWHDLRTARTVNFPGYFESLAGDYDAQSAQVFGEVGYAMQAGLLQWEPFAGAAYVNLHTNSFGERGGEAALSGSGDTTDTTFSTLGIHSSASLGWGDTALALSGSLGWRHAFNGTTPKSTLAFPDGSPFVIEGAPIAHNAAVAEVGVDAKLQYGISLGLYYIGQFGSGANDQGFRGTFTWIF